MAQLVQRLRGILGDHCGFWVEFHPLQAARGLVTTPYPLCAMLLGIRLGAPSATEASCSVSATRVQVLPCCCVHDEELNELDDAWLMRMRRAHVSALVTSGLPA